MKMTSVRAEVSKPIYSAVHPSIPQSERAMDSCKIGMCKMQRGFSLVSAIFLLVVIAALGTFAVTLSTAQQQSSALDVLGSRAYQASRAGIEWGAYQVIQNSAVAGGFAKNCLANSPGASTVQAVPGMAGTLSVFSVSVACGATAASDVIAATSAPGTVTVYRIVSTANGVAGATPGSTGYVERQMTVTIGQP